jgi:acyl-CoA synthetase (AMP-forming)/AMP-acid ligase II
VISDIPKYRLAQYPAHVQIHTWESSDHSVLDSADFQRFIQQSILDCSGWKLRKGDAVCILASAGHGALAAFEFAIMHCGGIVVPIHMGLPDADMQVIFSEVKPRHKSHY